MASTRKVPDNLAPKHLSVETLEAYIHWLDPERYATTNMGNLDMLLGLLKACRYQTVADLHERIIRGWNRFLTYEKERATATQPLSATLAIFLTLVLCDKEFRSRMASDQEHQELKRYFCD